MGVAAAVLMFVFVYRFHAFIFPGPPRSYPMPSPIPPSSRFAAALAEVFDVPPDSLHTDINSSQVVKLHVWKVLGRHMTGTPKEPWRVLDIGCLGWNLREKMGLTTAEAKASVELSLLEPHEPFIHQYCEGIYDHVMPIIAQDIISKYPQRLGYYDLVASFGVLGWIDMSEEEIRDYITNIHAALKPGGVALLMLDNGAMRLKEYDQRVSIPKHILPKFQVVKEMTVVGTWSSNSYSYPSVMVSRGLFDCRHLWWTMCHEMTFDGTYIFLALIK